MVGMLIGVPFLVAAVSVESPWVCVGLLMGARLFNESALAGYMSLPTEMSSRHIGAIWGCMSMLGSLGGSVATLFAGYQVATTGNWALPFYTAAGGIIMAALVMAFGVSAQPLVFGPPKQASSVQPKAVNG